MPTWVIRYVNEPVIEVVAVDSFRAKDGIWYGYLEGHMAAAFNAAQVASIVRQVEPIPVAESCPGPALGQGRD